MTSTESTSHPRPLASRKFVTVAFGLLLFAGMVFAVANVWFLAATDQSVSIEKFPTVLQQHGLSGRAPRVAAGVVPIAHEQTFEVTIDDLPVWLVYFDPFDPAQAEARDKVRHDGSIELDGQQLAAKVRGAVALVGYKGHPEERKLLAAFADFQVPGQ